MARLEQVILVCDMTGQRGDDVQTVEFVVDDAHLQADLSPEKLAEFKAAVEPFVNASRRVGTVRLKHAVHGARPQSAGAPVDRQQNSAIRDWAKARGMKVSDRGRIPEYVLTAYHQRR